MNRQFQIVIVSSDLESLAHVAEIVQGQGHDLFASRLSANASKSWIGPISDWSFATAIL